MIENRIKSQGVDKTQQPKQLPVKTVQQRPTKAELVNMNVNSIIHDETNNEVYFKGTKYTTKITGVRV